MIDATRHPSDRDGSYPVLEKYRKLVNENRGLTEFANSSTHILFDEDESGEEWDKLVETLEEKGIELDEGSWSRLG